MRLYLLNSECTPDASHPEFMEIAGSFVWVGVVAETESEAIEAARSAVSLAAFKMKRVEEIRSFAVDDTLSVPPELSLLAKRAVVTPGSAVLDEFFEYESTDDDSWKN
jgi:hypothetical protein